MVATKAKKTKNRGRAKKTSRNLAQKSIEDFCAVSDSISQHAHSTSPNQRPLREFISSTPFLPENAGTSNKERHQDNVGENPQYGEEIGNWSLDPGLLPLDPRKTTQRKKTGSQGLQGLESEETRIIYIQLLDQCFLSARSNQNTFKKLDFLKQQLADIKATLQCNADVIKLGILKAAPPSNPQDAEQDGPRAEKEM
ncbi:hypothetical protein JRQ81_017524, partial [Phrynocephalus forsythii]